MASEHAPEELEKLITELTAWCEAKYGRQTELADRLGVSKQLVANWFADTEHRPWNTFLKSRRFFGNNQRNQRARMPRVHLWGLGRYHKTRMSEQKPLQTKTRGFEVTGYMGLGSRSSGFLFSGFLSFSLVSLRSRYLFWYPEFYCAPMKQNVTSVGPEGLHVSLCWRCA
jgi:hypothetical protein